MQKKITKLHKNCTQLIEMYKYLSKQIIEKCRTFNANIKRKILYFKFNFF